MLQTVTPIDHFPLSFLGLRGIDPLTVAIKQQNSGLQCHAVAFSKEHYLRNFNGLLIGSCDGQHLPLGKLFPQFCEGKGEADQPIFMLRKMDARKNVPSSTRLCCHVGPGGSRKSDRDGVG
ncbi:hypothetical protein [Mesorhizobium temperatum]|uniref:hypothetical protein n=1 Tax=Mesorhizobium temperatum TaxID=241416 RepID=UPI0011801802|nr:hypothetical protein [Mesorhizobium temperatum]